MCSKKEELNDFLNDFNMKLASVTFEFKYSKEKMEFLNVLYKNKSSYPWTILYKKPRVVKITCTQNVNISTHYKRVLLSCGKRKRKSSKKNY